MAADRLLLDLRLRPERAAARQPGYDAVMQAEGGLMSITGDADGPPFRLGVAIADIVSGMFAAQGITLALLARDPHGRGQLVDIGMLDSTVALLTYQAASYFATGRSRRTPRQPASDDRPLRNISSRGRRVRPRGRQRRTVERFCLVAGLDQLAGDPRFATNSERVPALRRDEADPRRAAAHAKPREWIAALNAQACRAACARHR